jgi:hypothetical protein
MQLRSRAKKSRTSTYKALQLKILSAGFSVAAPYMTGPKRSFSQPIQSREKEQDLNI